MVTAVVTVLLTFILTGILGNSIVQAWQHRNWIIQRRIQEAELRYAALQKTFDEVSELAGKRQHRMFRLLSSLTRNDEDVVRKRLAEYDEASTLWNERLVAQFSKLTMQLTHGLSLQLEREIQSQFVKLDGELGRATVARLKGTKLRNADFVRLSNMLNGLQGRIGTFNKRTLRYIDDEKKALYQPEKLSLRTLDRFPTWELFKALFKPRQSSFDEL